MSHFLFSLQKLFLIFQFVFEHQNYPKIYTFDLIFFFHPATLNQKINILQKIANFNHANVCPLKKNPKLTFI